MDRREFLKFLGLATSAAVFDPIAAIVIEGHRYVNRRLGVVLEGPPGWRFVSHRHFSDILASQQLAIFDEELARELRADLETPLLVITRYPDCYSDISPTIIVRADPVEPDLADDFLELCELMAEGTRLMLKDVSVMKSRVPCQISGRSGCRSECQYTYEHTDGRSGRVRMDSIALDMGPMVYIFELHDPVDHSSNAAEFERFLDSVTLV